MEIKKLLSEISNVKVDEKSSDNRDLYIDFTTKTYGDFYLSLERKGDAWEFWETYSAFHHEDNPKPCPLCSGNTSYCPYFDETLDEVMNAIMNHPTMRIRNIASPIKWKRKEECHGENY